MIRRPLSALVAFPLIAGSAWGQTAATLKEAAEAAGLNIGIATNSFNVTNSSYANVAKAQFNMVVCENEMKFDNTEGPIGTFKFNGGDQVATFATANNMKMRGHTFVWHSQSNTASAAIRDRATGLTVMRNHIEGVGTHFKSKIHEWDVLNEITADGGGGLRGSFWKNNIGEDFCDSAIVIARRVIGSEGNLYYNDYGADGVNSKSTSIYNLAKKWIQNKVPVDGIGLQSHLNAGLRKDDISNNIKRFGELGLRISMTEIDIKNATAADWSNLMTACLENFNCVSFVTWGLSDQNSWLGSGCGCLLFSGNPPTAKSQMIQGLLDALSKADPAITAKRKAFAAKTPGTYGGPVGIYDLTQPVARKAAKTLYGLAPVPVFSVGAKVIDPLGRAKPVAPASFSGLEILAK
jgi:endo-1,4-beta-xylanase